MAYPWVTSEQWQMGAWQSLAKLNQLSLIDFARCTFSAYRAEPAHRLIASTLDRVLSGEIKRLMIFAPPQHGKSELASVRFPAYYLGRRPDDPIILTSHTASLAHHFSRRTRSVVEGEEYSHLWPEIRTDQGTRAVEHWSLASPSRGSLLAAGVGGPIMGHGGMTAIIDDPHKSWEEAQSETIRKKIQDWYRGTLRGRIWEGGAFVLIGSRLHDDDLAGWLLKEQPGQWVVLRLPALAETQEERDANNEYLGLPTGEPDPLGRAPGEALCPLRFSREELLRIQADVGSLAWGSEYQGVARLPEGNWIHRGWFEIVQGAPEAARRVRYWDIAATPGGGAYTVGELWAYAQGTWYVEDVVRGQWSPDACDKAMLDTAKRDAERYKNRVIIWFEQEPGSSGVRDAAAIRKLLTGFPAHADRVTGSKDVRMRPMISQAEGKRIKLVRAPWNAAWLNELCLIPNGKYRDQADAASGAFDKLVGMGNSYTISEY